jgi:hypothetical protein
MASSCVARGRVSRLRARSGDGESVGTPRTATAALPVLSIGYHGFRDAAFPGSRCRIKWPGI